MAVLIRLAISSLLGALLTAGALPAAFSQGTSAGIATDKPQYHPGEPINICYTVPGAGPITITDYSSDGSASTLASYDDDGTGGCISAVAQGPASTERLVLAWSSGNDSGSAQTSYRVADAAPARVLTSDDANRTVNVSVGDTIRLALGDVRIWTVTASDPTVLQTASGALPAGVQGEWLAGSPGQATISGRGDPRCYPQCRVASVAYSVTILVVQASAPTAQGTSMVEGCVVLNIAGGAAPPPGTPPRISSASAGPGIPVSAVVAGNGTADPVATTTTDDGGAFMLALPPGSYWVFVPRAAGDGFVRLSAGTLQRMPDGTVVLAWQPVDLSGSADITVTLGISIAAP